MLFFGWNLIFSASSTRRTNTRMKILGRGSGMSSSPLYMYRLLRKCTYVWDIRSCMTGDKEDLFYCLSLPQQLVVIIAHHNILFTLEVVNLEWETPSSSGLRGRSKKEKKMLVLIYVFMRMTGLTCLDIIMHLSYWFPYDEFPFSLH